MINLFYDFGNYLDTCCDYSFLFKFFFTILYGVIILKIINSHLCRKKTVNDEIKKIYESN